MFGRDRRVLSHSRGCQRRPTREIFVPLACVPGLSPAEVERIVRERQTVYSTPNAEEVYFQPRRNLNLNDDSAMILLETRETLEAEREVEILTEPEDEREKMIKFVGYDKKGVVADNDSNAVKGTEEAHEGTESETEPDSDVDLPQAMEGTGNDEWESGTNVSVDGVDSGVEIDNDSDADPMNAKSLSADPAHSLNDGDHDDRDKSSDDSFDPFDLNLPLSTPPSGPELTLEMIMEAEKALSAPEGTEVVSDFCLKMTNDELRSLYTNETWLDDKNVDFYLKMIEERSKSGNYPTIFVFPCFFQQLYTKQGYKYVENVTKDVNIFEKDIVFFPWILHHHWRLAALSFGKRTLQLYNSMQHEGYNGVTDKRILSTIRQYLRTELNAKFKNEQTYHQNLKEILSSSKEWDQGIVPREETPQQKNATDCGVFALQFAEYLSRGKAFDFEQEHIPYFRKRMTYEAITKELLTK